MCCSLLALQMHAALLFLILWVPSSSSKTLLLCFLVQRVIIFAAAPGFTLPQPPAAWCAACPPASLRLSRRSTNA